MVTLQLRQIKILPGQRVDLENVGWQTLEKILMELGDRRSTRIAYSNQTLTIVAPHFRHKKTKVVLGDLVKVLLDELEVDYDASGSTTLKRQDLGKGVEPDDSFYIQNFARVLNKDRIDLTVDPPPDLAIEVDLTSKTQLEVYEALGIPELWRYDGGRLRIDVLQQGRYVEVSESSIFPGWAIANLAEEYVRRSLEVGQGRAMREFRQRVQQR
ncbi:MAG: Uma2 family endonuclease [Leptolyngbyaceae cyanobacterium SL_1_1]|nr:Uma2 family endonuclease [Leptolyngbyaceae cyanobacterium RM1_1_2]NJO09572.1 Uma2 family endonuclease [Leptolyngbyaceae cyanobacterium SL_1_1]